MIEISVLLNELTLGETFSNPKYTAREISVSGGAHFILSTRPS